MTARGFVNSVDPAVLSRIHGYVRRRLSIEEQILGHVASLNALRNELATLSDSAIAKREGVSRSSVTYYVKGRLS